MEAVPPLRLDAGFYRRVLEDLGLWEFPRKVGIPEQHIEGSPDSFLDWLAKHYGQPVPLFVAHSALTVPDDGERVNENIFRFSAAFGDFDTGDGSGLSPPEVWAEVQRASRRLVEWRIDHAWKYSGSEAGFHLRVFFQPETRPRKYLERWENAFWRGLKHDLGLRSINIRCANPICLERLPYTPYVHKKDKTTKGYKQEPNYCVPVPWQWVHEGEMDRIRSLSFAPYDVGAVRYRGAPLYGLESFVRLMGWEAFGHEANALHPLPSYSPSGSAFDLNKVLIPKRKCLQILPFGPNPRHAVRLAFVHEHIAIALAAGLPWSLDDLIAFIDKVAEEAQWEDRHNEKIRHDQVLYAWKRPYAYNRDGTVRDHGMECRWLRENGVCLGPSCPVFRVKFPEEWAEHVAKHPETAAGVVA